MNKNSKLNKKQSNRTKKSAKSTPDGTSFNIIGTGMPRGMPVVGEKTFSMCQTIDGLGNLVSSNSVEAFAAFNFTANNCAQAATFAALFDQYRIAKIELWLIPRLSDNAVVSNPGLLTTVIDYDDANTPTTTSSLTEYRNALTTSGLNGHYRVWQPHCAVDLYNGSFAGFGNVKSPWIDAASLTVQHYGIKVGITVTSAPFTYDTRTRLWLTFRNVH